MPFEALGMIETKGLIGARAVVPLVAAVPAGARWMHPVTVMVVAELTGSSRLRQTSLTGRSFSCRILYISCCNVSGVHAVATHGETPADVH